MTMTRASMNGPGRYAAIFGALHSIDKVNQTRRRREGVELCGLLLAIGVLVVAMGL